MKGKSVRKKQAASALILLTLLGAVIFSSCNGQALVNFTYDPTTGVGSGNIQITGAPPEATSASGGGSSGGASNQVVLFAVVVALLIGTLAVVAASSRRRRIE